MFPTTEYGDTRLPDRFWSFVYPEPNTGCWLWGPPGSVDGNGRSRYSGTSGHQFAYRGLIGPVSPGLELDHLCETPICVNPAHLEPVTRLENMRRRYRDYTHCSKGHEYTPENTYRKLSNGYRDCKTCKLDRLRAFYRRRRQAA